MKHYTEILSVFAYGLTYEAIPDEAIDTTKHFIADWFASAFAGMRVNGAFSATVLEVLRESCGVKEASVLFTRDDNGETVLLSAADAAAMNAVYAHGADMDDGNRRAMGHIGAHVISAVFALAEALFRRRGEPIDGKELLTARTVGYEVYNRVSAAAQPGLVRRGFHSTGTAGAIACAAACAKLRGLDASGIYAAMSVAAVQSGGLLVIAESGQSCKPLNPANAARLGVFCSALAEKGIDAPVYPLESEKGWLHAMTDEPHPERITDGLGTSFTVCESYLKPYPSCRHTHAAIEAALAVREALVGREEKLNSADIAEIDVRIYPNAISVAGQIVTPRGDSDTKFSIHYAVARALETGAFCFDDLSISAMTDMTESLISRIILTEAAEMEDAERGKRGACVTLTLVNGERLSQCVDIPKGDSANPFTRADIERKLSECASGYLDTEGQKTLVSNVFALEIRGFTALNTMLEA